MPHCRLRPDGLRSKAPKDFSDENVEACLTTRLISRTVTFARPFILDEVDGELPAGPYEVETEEETIDGVSFLAYRRLSTHIIARPDSGAAQMWAIHPDGLASALARDKTPPA